MANLLLEVFPGDADLLETALWLADFALKGQHPGGLFYGTYYLEPRGSREAFDAYNLDLQFSKGFTISQLRLVLIGSIYNTFSTEYGTGVCNSPSGCGQYEMGDATTWTTPRRYEVGFRIEF